MKQRAHHSITQLESALRPVIEKRSPYRRKILLLTSDGKQPGNSSSLTSLIEKAQVQVFPIIIPSSSSSSEDSRELFRDIAEAGQGVCEFVLQKERMEPKLQRQLKRALGYEFKVQSIEIYK